MISLVREGILLAKYIRQAAKCRQEYHRCFEWSDAVSYYLPWRKTMTADGHCLEHEIPWLTFPSIRQLSSLLTSEMRVFEYGSGGSTLFFANRVAEVISVEHDEAWYARLMPHLEKQNTVNFTVYHIPPRDDPTYYEKEPSDPDGYVSSLERYKGLSFHEYASKIECYPDNYFDVVVIDGRARPSCFKHAIQKVSRQEC